MAQIFDVYTRLMRNVMSHAEHNSSILTTFLKEIGFVLFYVIELYYTIAVSSFVQEEVDNGFFAFTKIMNSIFSGPKNSNHSETM